MSYHHQHHHYGMGMGLPMGGMGMGMGGMMGMPGMAVPTNTGGTGGSGGPRVCAYFMTPRGCAKGAACTFPHISPPSSSDPYASAAAAAEIFGAVGTRVSAPSMGSGGRTCAFYFSPRGCSKGHECGFSHQMPPSGSPSGSYQHMEPPTHAQMSAGNIVAGGVQMTTTGGTHPLAKTRMCAYYQSARGCAKGGLCDFSHDAHALAMAALAESAKPKKGQCAFWSTKGCVKGDACDFAHIGPAGNGSSGSIPPSPTGYASATSSPRLAGTPSSSRHTPSVAELAAAVVAASQQASSTSSSSTSASPRPSAAGSKPCAYYSTARGCAKGDACDFAHIGTSTSGATPAASIAPTKASMSGHTLASPSTATSPSSSSSASAGTSTASGVRRTTDSKESSSDNNSDHKTDDVKIVGEGGVSLIVKRCLFYNNPRGCSKGDKCDFAHVVGDNNGSEPQLVDGKRVCTYFSTQRGCVKGDACDFVHLRPDGTLAASRARAVPLATRPCAFFLQPRGCAKGQACDFSHDFGLLATAYAATVPDLWHATQSSSSSSSAGASTTTADITRTKDKDATSSSDDERALQEAIAQASLPDGHEPPPDSDDDEEWADDLARIQCRDHWRGFRCLAGDRCRFLHDRDAPRRIAAAAAAAAKATPSSSSSSSSSLAVEGEGTKKRRTENGHIIPSAVSIAVTIEDKSDEHVKAVLFKYMKAAMAVSPKMIAFLTESPDLYAHVRRALADFAFDTLHSSDVFSPSPSPIPSPLPSPTNATAPSSLSSSIPSSSSLSSSAAAAAIAAAAAMTQQAAVPGVAIEAVDPSLQVDTTASLSGENGTAPPTPAPSPPPSGLNGPTVIASRPSVSEFLTPLRQAHLSLLADQYITQLMAGQCNLPDAKQSLAFLAASLAATPDVGPAASLPLPSSSSTSSSSAAPSLSSSSSSSSNGSSITMTSTTGTGNGNGHGEFAFDNPYMRNFR